MEHAIGLNFCLRDTPYSEGVTYQISPYWNAPFHLGPLARAWEKQGSLFAGTEVDFWWNEFVIAGKHEAVPQAMVKWVF